MSTKERYSPETRERAVDMVFEHQSEYESHLAAVVSISGKIRCTGENLLKWVRRSETYQGKRSGMFSSNRELLIELEREIRKLNRANEILHRASNQYDQPPPGFSVQL